ncbi:MAG TPA: hypothetical protein VM555_10810, partial [Tahibacter sp.]|nr:hypothetical protein [Tahibacter sp.]
REHGRQIARRERLRIAEVVRAAGAGLHAAGPAGRTAVSSPNPWQASLNALPALRPAGSSLSRFQDEFFYPTVH